MKTNETKLNNAFKYLKKARLKAYFSMKIFENVF